MQSNPHQEINGPTNSFRFNYIARGQWLIRNPYHLLATHSPRFTGHPVPPQAEKADIDISPG
ncbi:hypothetical protein [Burkholderia cepacia]|uniref:hypothetical protein n=1 Tax=Burkholderia cepacia TaxID=292 RepID=UPI00398EEFCE